MAKKSTDKLAAKRTALVERTALALGVSIADAQRLLSLGRTQSLRINTLKSTSGTLKGLQHLGWAGQPYSWFADGYTAEAGLEAIRDSTLVANGEVYIQNAASWLPVLALDPQPGESILDVCAAPGGKTSLIAALTQNQASITANDNSRPRLAKLQANLERLGVQGVEYTLYDATRLATKLQGKRFDRILLDAPCSGEGMMRYGSDKDFATWSVAHIKRLEQLQRRIITQVWQLLKPGGTLVYSTCTMAPEENEAVVDYLLRKQPGAVVQPLPFDLPGTHPAVLSWNGRSFSPSICRCLRLAPSPTTEAFFVAKLSKSAQSPTEIFDAA